MATTPTVAVPAAEQPVPDPLRHHEHYQSGDASPYAGGSSFMERVAEGVASGLGTVGFVVISTLIIVVWIALNAAKAVTFDAYPFILLNLAFSAQAFYTGALVIIAQKAQTRTDKANEEASARHRDELAKYQSDLLEKNTDLTEQIRALTEKVHALTEQVHAATCVGPRR
jgi:uncharacterized membrane protein